MHVVPMYVHTMHVCAYVHAPAKEVPVCSLANIQRSLYAQCYSKVVILKISFFKSIGVCMHSSIVQ